MQQTKTSIHINRLRIYAYHGVLPQERTVGNDYEVSLCLYVNAVGALYNDDLNSTVNYAEVIDVVKSQMAIPSDLLEHVASRIRRALVQRFPLIYGGEIYIAKLAPPISAQMQSVGVSIKW